jgi:outer membrane protein OmpA-like peptidoglycan-associated protein
MYFHGDFLWNMSNALSGYKETRFWNLVPYVHTGYFRSYGLDDVDFAENEFALGVGLLHNLRLTDMLDLIIDMRATAVKGDVIASAGPTILGSVTAGLAVDLGWPNFVRTSTIIGSVEMANAEKVALLETAALALEAANDALERENLNLANKNEKLNDQIKRLKQRESTEMDMTAFFEGISPAVYFEIGKTVLAPDELRHLQFIAENLILKAEAGTDIVITVMGTADSNTGTTRRNQFLSEARGKYVCDILINDYGISPDRISIQSDVIKAAGNPALERAVVFTF